MKTRTLGMGTDRYSDVSLNNFYSERFLFWKVLIPKGRFSKLYLVLWSERLIIRKVSAPKILIPQCHCSERFLIQKVFIPNSFYPEQFLIRMVLIPKGHFSEIQNKKPFRSRSKNFMIYDLPLAHSSATSMDDGLMMELKSNHYGFPNWNKNHSNKILSEKWHVGISTCTPWYGRLKLKGADHKLFWVIVLASGPAGANATYFSLCACARIEYKQGQGQGHPSPCCMSFWNKGLCVVSQ